LIFGWELQLPIHGFSELQVPSSHYHQNCYKICLVFHLDTAVIWLVHSAVSVTSPFRNGASLLYPTISSERHASPYDLIMLHYLRADFFLHRYRVRIKLKIARYSLGLVGQRTVVSAEGSDENTRKRSATNGRAYPWRALDLDHLMSRSSTQQSDITLKPKQVAIEPYELYRSRS
jgi:hypothetical protein